MSWMGNLLPEGATCSGPLEIQSPSIHITGRRRAAVLAPKLELISMHSITPGEGNFKGW